MNNPYTWNYAQYQQPQAQNNQGLLWVQGETGARAYMVAPGQTVLLMDSEGSSFFIKSADASGMPLPLRIFDYKEREAKSGLAVEEMESKYVTRAEYEKLQSIVDSLKRGEADAQ